MRYIIEHFGSKDVQNRLAKYLEDELTYAVENVEFYKHYREFKSLQDFPVINKALVRDNESAFMSPAYEKSKLFKQETSGSTGMPFAVYQDPLKRKRATADNFLFFGDCKI